MAHAVIEVRRLRPDDAAVAGRIVQQAYFASPGYPGDNEYDQTLGDVAHRSAEADVVVALDG